MNIDLNTLSTKELYDLQTQLTEKIKNHRQAVAQSYLNRIVEIMNEARDHGVECKYFDNGWRRLYGNNCYLDSDNDIVFSTD